MPAITLHGGATLVSDDPPCVWAPAVPWSYAASVAVEGPPDSEAVAGLLVRVREGRVGVSVVDPAGQHLRHEVALGPTAEPVLVEQVVQPDERGLLMMRTGAEAAPASVEVHDLTMRPVTAEERAAADASSMLEPMTGWSAFYGNYARSVPEQLRSHAFDRLEAEIVRPWLDGLSLIVTPREQISRAAYVSGVYEPDTALLLKEWLGPGSVMLDVGANIGLFTMLASRWAGPSGRVVAVEPSPRERRRLLAHLSVNHIDNVEVIAAAVADREGSADLLVATTEHSGLNTLARTFAYPGVAAAETIAVPLVTLDALVERTGLSRVDVIKLDVEGGEYAALKGAASMLRHFRPRLIVEIVGRALDASGASVGDVADLLADAGYELFQIDDHAALTPIRDPRYLRDHNVAAIPRAYGQAD